MGTRNHHCNPSDVLHNTPQHPTHNWMSTLNLSPRTLSCTWRQARCQGQITFCWSGLSMKDPRWKPNSASTSNYEKPWQSHVTLEMTLYSPFLRREMKQLPRHLTLEHCRRDICPHSLSSPFHNRPGCTSWVPLWFQTLLWSCRHGFLWPTTEIEPTKGRRWTWMFAAIRHRLVCKELGMWMWMLRWLRCPGSCSP